MKFNLLDEDNYPYLPPIYPGNNLQTYLLRWLLVALLALLILLFFTGCAIVRYHAQPDGSTQVSIYSLGSDKILQDFKASIDPKGVRKLSIGSLDENQTEGLKQVNEGMKMIVEGAAKGAIAGAK